MISLRGCLRKQVPLADFTSWHVGGQASQLYEPKDNADLVEFLKQLPKSEPLLFLGLGSNTLIRDGGFKGTVVITQGTLNQLEQIDSHIIRAEAGVASPALARFAARHHLSGAEFLAGIPGTIGGALVMNAGCNGGETWDIVQKVEVITRQGDKKWRTPQDYQVSYRNVSEFANEYFLAGHFLLKPGSKDASLKKIRNLLAYRAETQPTHSPSCGSVFRNPPGDHAARLIEACGLKGKQIGGAIVSSKHANFIINEGHATALDIETLIAEVKDTVLKMKGISLIPEVRMIGER